MRYFKKGERNDCKRKDKNLQKGFQWKGAYSRSISSQEYKDGQKGDWIRAYEPVQFPKGVDIADGSMVEIEGFEEVFKNKDGEIRRKLVVSKYRVEGGQNTVEDDMPF